VVYLEQWGALQSRMAEEESELVENPR